MTALRPAASATDGLAEVERLLIRIGDASLGMIELKGAEWDSANEDHIAAVAEIRQAFVVQAAELDAARAQLARFPVPAGAASGAVAETDVDDLLGLPRGLHLGDAVDHVFAGLDQSRRVGVLVPEERPKLARLITVARAMAHRLDEARASAAARGPEGVRVPAEDSAVAFQLCGVCPVPTACSWAERCAAAERPSRAEGDGGRR